MWGGDDGRNAEEMAGRAVGPVVRAIEKLGLRVAPSKTQAMLFYEPRNGKPPAIGVDVAGVRIGTGPTLKYLHREKNYV